MYLYFGELNNPLGHNWELLITRCVWRVYRTTCPCNKTSIDFTMALLKVMWNLEVLEADGRSCCPLRLYHKIFLFGDFIGKSCLFSQFIFDLDKQSTMFVTVVFRCRNSDFNLKPDLASIWTNYQGNDYNAGCDNLASKYIYYSDKPPLLLARCKLG